MVSPQSSSPNNNNNSSPAKAAQANEANEAYQPPAKGRRLSFAASYARLVDEAQFLFTPKVQVLLGQVLNGCPLLHSCCCSGGLAIFLVCAYYLCTHRDELGDAELERKYREQASFGAMYPAPQGPRLQLQLDEGSLSSIN